MATALATATTTARAHVSRQRLRSSDRNRYRTGPTTRVDHPSPGAARVPPPPAQVCWAYSGPMSIAISDDHRALAQTASDFLRKADARGAARALLEAPAE